MVLGLQLPNDADSADGVRFARLLWTLHRTLSQQGAIGIFREAYRFGEWIVNDVDIDCDVHFPDNVFSIGSGYAGPNVDHLRDGVLRFHGLGLELLDVAHGVASPNSRRDTDEIDHGSLVRNVGPRPCRVGSQRHDWCCSRFWNQ